MTAWSLVKPSLYPRQPSVRVSLSRCYAGSMPTWWCDILSFTYNWKWNSCVNTTVPSKDQVKVTYPYLLNANTTTYKSKFIKNQTQSESASWHKHVQILLFKKQFCISSTQISRLTSTYSLSTFLSASPASAVVSASLWCPPTNSPPAYVFTTAFVCLAVSKGSEVFPQSFEQTTRACEHSASEHTTSLNPFSLKNGFVFAEEIVMPLGKQKKLWQMVGGAVSSTYSICDRLVLFVFFQWTVIAARKEKRKRSGG